MISKLLLIVLAIAAVVLWQAAYKVDETELVLVTQFGEIRAVETSPGLQFKVPFVQQVTRLDKRVLRVDVQPAGFPDKESQFLEIDAYVRYKIQPTELGIQNFRESLLTETGARDKISQIAIASLRAEVGNRLREQIIGGRITVNPDGTRTVTAILAPDGSSIREQLTRIVTASVQAQADAQGFGIDIIDVRIKRADFPESIVESVYTRMRSERQVQAERLRAEGEQQFLTKTAEVDKAVENIAASADETSNRLRGDGEAEAIRILAEALEADADLFAFRRSLQAYATILGSQSTLVLSANSPLFQFLQTPDGLGE
ncbi:MAG: protease modulator HflC [Chloroflexi bacterium]|nr:protease modulator HflC [Chloroflexota bacterium]